MKRMLEQMRLNGGLGVAEGAGAEGIGADGAVTAGGAERLAQANKDKRHTAKMKTFMFFSAVMVSGGNQESQRFKVFSPKLTSRSAW